MTANVNLFSLAVEAYRKHGSQRKAAEELGISRRSLRYHLSKAKETGLVRHEDPAIDDAMLHVNTFANPGGMWIKTDKDENGIARSVYIPKQDADYGRFIDQIREAFDGMVPTKPVMAPKLVHDDLCTVYPLMDLHFGMHAWGAETNGPDYDIKLACRDIRYAFAKIMSITPNSKEAILILGGDTLHADDNNAETPTSKHKLDVDGRQHKVIEAAIDILSETIERLLEKHEHLTIRTLRGNHDTHSHMVLAFALAQRYRNELRVTVDMSPRDLFMKRWGKSAIFAHHGDKGKPERMALYISDICPFWSDTRHRHYFVGHVHHDNAKDIGPLRYESLRAFCPPDSYAAGMGYGARRALQAITFHKIDGIVLRAIDPIERDDAPGQSLAEAA